MKYKTIGAFKGVQNVGNCKAVVDLKVGMGVILDRAAKTAALPASVPPVRSAAAAYSRCGYGPADACPPV